MNYIHLKGGKANKGNNYNKIRTQTNGRTVSQHSAPVKVACFYDGDTIKACAVWYDNGIVQDCDRPNTSVKKYMRNWHRIENHYYHGTQYAYSDVTYAKYLKHTHVNNVDLDI